MFISHDIVAVALLHIIQFFLFNLFPHLSDERGSAAARQIRAKQGARLWSGPGTRRRCRQGARQLHRRNIMRRRRGAQHQVE